MARQKKKKNNHVPPRAIQIRAMNEVEFGVSPVKLLLAVVQRQPIRPVDIGVDDHGSICAIHSCPLDLWDLTPVRPVQVTKGRGKKAMI